MPEALVPGVLQLSHRDFLAERGYTDVQEVITAEEKLVFSLPRELKGSILAAPGPSGTEPCGAG